jgi:hypothetical protein
MFDTDLIHNITMNAAAIVPIIVAIVQALKYTNWVKEGHAPFLSVLVGIGVAFLLAHDFMVDMSGTILTGILWGLAASGLYSGVKETTHHIQMKRRAANHKKDDI